MGNTKGYIETTNEAESARAAPAPAGTRDGSGSPRADAIAHPDHQAAAPASQPSAVAPQPAVRPPSHPWKKRLVLAGVAVGLVAGGYVFLAPWVETMLTTVSTDDAYVNGHVTYVAPRVAGQVSRVLVDDNDRVNKGDLLIRLDKAL